MLAVKLNSSQTDIRNVKSSAGFTLVELMVVVSIIAVLSLIGLVLYSGAQSKARDSIRKSDLNNLALALDIYYQKNGSYPNHCNDGVLYGGCGNSSCAAAFSSNSQPWLPELTSDYMTQPLSVDPINTYTQNVFATHFVYNYQSKNIAVSLLNCDTSHFVIGAHLENTNDPAINWDPTGLTIPGGDFSGGWGVNYVVTDK